MAEYEPSLPWGKKNPHATDDAVKDEGDRGGGTAPWTSAPAESHISVWSYMDVREYPFLRKFPGLLGPGSQLLVRFKVKGGGESPTYMYLFADPDYGKTIADELASSPHPYSEILYPKVIKGGIPYTRA